MTYGRGFRQNIVTETFLEPATDDKFGASKRLVFRRRQRMADKNLLIVFFDGVIGDLPYISG